jgi:prepilin-type N-terminal cleavage/methylation domain-containing protein
MKHVTPFKQEPVRSRGFTLIETLTVVAISAVAFLALVNLFLTFNSLHGFQQVLMATAGSAGTAMNALEATVPSATHVLSSRSFSGVTYTSATTTLVLELPTIDASGTIITGVNDYAVFFASSTTLYRLIRADALSARRTGTTTLSTTLNSISFTYNNADFTQVTAVTTDLQTRALYKQQVAQSHLLEELHLRNYTSP